MEKTTIRLKTRRRLRRKHHIRKRVRGTAERPRLSVFRSSKHIYAQVIDDDQGRTLVAMSSLAKDLRTSLGKGSDREAAKAVGRALAEKATSAGIKRVVFDRNGFAFHGRVKALAEGARENGLEF